MSLHVGSVLKYTNLDSEECNTCHKSKYFCKLSDFIYFWRFNFFPPGFDIFAVLNQKVFMRYSLGIELFFRRQQWCTYSSFIELYIGCILTRVPEGSYLVLFSLSSQLPNKILLIFSHININFYFAVCFSGLLQDLSVSSFGL